MSGCLVWASPGAWLRGPRAASSQSINIVARVIAFLLRRATRRTAVLRLLHALRLSGSGVSLPLLQGANRSGRASGEYDRRRSRSSETHAERPVNEKSVRLHKTTGTGITMAKALKHTASHGHLIVILSSFHECSGASRPACHGDGPASKPIVSY